MTIELKMPALSPTMEKGTLAKWLVGVGDIVKPGDLIAEIETDKATMEFEAAEEGRLCEILVPEGTDGVPVGAVLAKLMDAGAPPVEERPCVPEATASPAREVARLTTPIVEPRPAMVGKASPLAIRIAAMGGIDLRDVVGSGPRGRIVRADLALSPAARSLPEQRDNASFSAGPFAIPDVPHTLARLSAMRKTIGQRLSASKLQAPHIYLTLDIQLGALLALRAELNTSLQSRGIKLSVNDMIIKALSLALIEVPTCNAMLSGDQLVTFERADISVAVSIPGGLITPIIKGADTKSLSTIATEMRDLAGRARDGKLRPDEYQGGTASISNLGMFGIRQFEAVINPPQAMILAVGAGEERPCNVNGTLALASVMTVTGSFDHRIVDGADAARLLAVLKRLVEEPVQLLV
ncbi:dihydrolipoamide acetyltransferase family protein (plasmid) [Novosphingobium sp. BL-8A]|uniref:dihydrolipoamide acetyltransferase family protein n=1 Tax=Novosphingobium sp. BL-8A TaxID=3127639 RepID=UPI003757D622